MKKKTKIIAVKTKISVNSKNFHDSNTSLNDKNQLLNYIIELRIETKQKSKNELILNN
jgi:hypothetical protein